MGLNNGLHVATELLMCLWVKQGGRVEEREIVREWWFFNSLWSPLEMELSSSARRGMSNAATFTDHRLCHLCSNPYKPFFSQVSSRISYRIYNQIESAPAGSQREEAFYWLVEHHRLSPLHDVTFPSDRTQASSGIWRVTMDTASFIGLYMFFFIYKEFEVTS